MDYIPSIFWFFGKTAVVIFIIMWFKWTFPRLRIDQLLRLEWRYLLPINLINLFLMVIIENLNYIFKDETMKSIIRYITSFFKGLIRC